MSRYQVDKLLRTIARNEQAKGEFTKDPVAFVEDADLTDAERQALIEKDFRTLYGLGAHSFLLFAFVMSVSLGIEKNWNETTAKPSLLSAESTIQREEYFSSK
jgi:hypothetical protein